jgi:astacin (peptidase family M12A)
MHYHSTAFSKNGQRTIDAIKPGLEGFVHHMGQSGRLDDWDVERLKKRYGC